MAACEPGVETVLTEGLVERHDRPRPRAAEWVQELGGRIPGRVLAGSSTFQYFAAAAPGAKELFAMVKIWELAQTKRWQRRARGYDTVVVDAPATGHALGMLASPRTFEATARVGPVAGQADKVRDLLCDPAQSAFVAVALATDMASQRGARAAGRNPRRARSRPRCRGRQRHPPAPLQRCRARAHRGASTAPGAPARGRRAQVVRHAAAHAARAVHDRATFQHGQLARLRRRGFDALGLPFVWQGHVDRAAVEGLAERIARHL